MKLGLMISTLCIASLGVTGCASKVPQPDEYSGFLSDYSQLREAKSPSGAEVMRWVDPKLNLNRYTSVYIEPTQFFPKPQATAQIPDATLRSIALESPRDLDALAGIGGVGASKLERYGREVIAALDAG